MNNLFKQSIIINLLYQHLWIARYFVKRGSVCAVIICRKVFRPGTWYMSILNWHQATICIVFTNLKFRNFNLIVQGVPKKTGISVLAGVSIIFFSQIIFILHLDYGKINEIFFWVQGVPKKFLFWTPCTSGDKFFSGWPTKWWKMIVAFSKFPFMYRESHKNVKFLLYKVLKIDHKGTIFLAKKHKIRHNIFKEYDFQGKKEKKNFQFFQNFPRVPRLDEWKKIAKKYFLIIFP